MSDVYSSQVTRCRMNCLCNRCSGWVHWKCSGLQNASEHRLIKHIQLLQYQHTPPTPQRFPPPILTKAANGNPVTICNLHRNVSAIKIIISQLEINITWLWLVENKLTSNISKSNIRMFHRP